jgi:hypothetical protein
VHQIRKMMKRRKESSSIAVEQHIEAQLDSNKRSKASKFESAQPQQQSAQSSSNSAFSQELYPGLKKTADLEVKKVDQDIDVAPEWMKVCHLPLRCIDVVGDINFTFCHASLSPARSRDRSSQCNTNRCTRFAFSVVASVEEQDGHPQLVRNAGRGTALI